MISRIIILLVILIVLPDVYLEYRNRHRRACIPWWKRLLRWMPSLFLLVYALFLSSERNFAPENTIWLNVFLLLLGVVVIPRLIYTICSFIGHLWCRLRGTRRNWGNLAGLLLALCAVYIVLYGSMVGSRRLVVRHVDIDSKDLPKAFDGYRLVQFSDLHIGSMKQDFLLRAIDSIHAQHADAIVFTGDLQNMQPQELYPFMEALRSLHAPDGVFSILGNHDYSYYLRGEDAAIRAANDKEVVSRERQLGWNLLLNEHHTLFRAGDSIVIAGEENDGKKPFPQKSDLRKTLKGVTDSAFVIMLQHDPSAWRRSILPRSHAQLTLSGHTHGGQLSLFGWRPTMLTNAEDRGLYRHNGRHLYVSSGLGGFIPFRFGVPPEIVVFTLHCHP